MDNPSPPRNIILAGFMGTGKSAVANLLALRLGWKFLDVDTQIEQIAELSIPEIFAQWGEASFRAIEAQCARQLATLERHVVATGGGLVLDPANLAAAREAGALVLLEATPETIYQRVQSETHRPLLQAEDPRARIAELLEARREAYGRIELRVSTDGKTPAEIADEIMERLNMEKPQCALGKVEVRLAERSYPIEAMVGQMRESFSPRPVALVTSESIAQHWQAPVVSALEAAGYKVSLCVIPAGEKHKTIETVSLIHDHMIERKFSRGAGLIALGGGVVGDIAGFAAASMLRGISFVQLPTTLLAMVDSSVGGKTGVNHRLGKNLIGAFWQPTYVGIELDFLKTLPAEELRSGMAEVIKYGVIADLEFFEYLETNIERALAGDAAVLARIVERSCAIKAQVVAGDEREETGLRAILNYGHTFGHAAEALGNYEAIRHGEGVAMGMAAAAHLAQLRGLLDAESVVRIERLIERAGLPTRMLKFGADDYWTKMGSDKKVKDGKIRFILPTRIGAVEMVDDVTRAEVDACLARVMAG